MALSVLSGNAEKAFWRRNIDQGEGLLGVRKTGDVAKLGCRIFFGFDKEQRLLFANAAQREIERGSLPPAPSLRDDDRILLGIAAGIGSINSKELEKEIVTIVEKRDMRSPFDSVIHSLAQQLASGEPLGQYMHTQLEFIAQFARGDSVADEIAIYWAHSYLARGREVTARAKYLPGVWALLNRHERGDNLRLMERVLLVQSEMEHAIENEPQQEPKRSLDDTNPELAVLDLASMLARTAFKPSDANIIVRRAGFPVEHLPKFTTALTFWTNVVEQTVGGMIALDTLIDQFVKYYPHNSEIREDNERFKEIMTALMRTRHVDL